MTAVFQNSQMQFSAVQEASRKRAGFDIPAVLGSPGATNLDQQQPG